MHRQFLKYLCDPYTGEELTLEVLEESNELIFSGYLVSNSNRFAIRNGIPRFNESDSSISYTKSFGFQWNRWPFVQFEYNNIGRPMQGHTKSMFNKITDLDLNHTDEVLVFCDFGCGSGRFIDLIAGSKSVVIGIDASTAVDAAASKFSENHRVLLCQADILSSPLKTGMIDYAYSIGVLHHTMNPYMGIREMSRVLKPGGSIAVSVYGRSGYYDDDFVRLARKVFKLLPPIISHKLAIIYSYFVVALTRPIYKVTLLRRTLRPLLMYLPHIQLPDFRWSILDTYDSITPSYQVGISSYEMYDFLHSAGIRNIRPTNWGGTAMKGVKVIEVEPDNWENSN